MNNVGDLWLTLGARGRLFFVSFRLDFSISFFKDFGTPRVPEKGTRWPNLWGCGKTSHSEKSMANTQAERHSSKIAQTGAVKERKLLRGKVSQGRPHPLRLRFEGKGQTLNKNKYSWALGQAVFFSRAERWHDFRHNAAGVWRASKGRAEPCRGAFKGFAPCRRPFFFYLKLSFWRP